MIQWLIDNWLKIAIPVLAFLATYVVGLWLRRVVDNAFERWTVRTEWEGSRFTTWFILWSRRSWGGRLSYRINNFHRMRTEMMWGVHGYLLRF